MAKQIKPQFATTLKELRKKRNLTQMELAELSGISVMTVKRYEAGDSFPDMGILGSLCVALKDDRLLEAWTQTEVSVKRVYYFKDMVFERVKDIAYRKIWDDIIKNGSWPFHRSLAQIGQSIQKMNSIGINEVIKITEVLSKVPEYRTEEDWAYIVESQEEEKEDGERKNES